MNEPKQARKPKRSKRSAQAKGTPLTKTLRRAIFALRAARYRPVEAIREMLERPEDHGLSMADIRRLKADRAVDTVAHYYRTGLGPHLQALWEEAQAAQSMIESELVLANKTRRLQQLDEAFRKARMIANTATDQKIVLAAVTAIQRIVAEVHAQTDGLRLKHEMTGELAIEHIAHSAVAGVDLATGTLQDVINGIVTEVVGGLPHLPGLGEALMRELIEMGIRPEIVVTGQEASYGGARALN